MIEAPGWEFTKLFMQICNIFCNFKVLLWIEGINIEYRNIEKCNIDTILTSKILRLVTSKR